MPRRKKHPIEPALAPGLLGTLAVMQAVVWLILILSGYAKVAVLLMVALGVTLVGRKLIRINRSKAVRWNIHNKAMATIEQYESQLARRWVQLVRQDAYGQLQLGGWVKEVDYFITNYVGPSLTGEEQSALNGERGEIARMITERAQAVTRDRPVFRAFSEDMTPTEFEVFCAEELRQSGWDARVTLQSRDQGVDVVAEKAGVRVVLQCKLYSKPVGNKAVQEIAAAKARERAHYGAVVSNSRYTPAAEQLAATNAILLLHYSDLANLEALLR